jgi:hypothetical protein
VTVLSTADISLPPLLSCRLVTVPEWLLEGVHLAQAAYLVLQWLERPP